VATISVGRRAAGVENNPASGYGPGPGVLCGQPITGLRKRRPYGADLGYGRLEAAGDPHEQRWYSQRRLLPRRQDPGDRGDRWHPEIVERRRRAGDGAVPGACEEDYLGRVLPGWTLSRHFERRWDRANMGRGAPARDIHAGHLQ